MTLPAAGDRLTAARLTDIIAPGWSTYTFTWSSTGTQPVIGNGTRSGRYRRSADSDLIIYEFRLTMGSTTTFGTGTYFISVPVTPSATAVTNACGACYMIDAGTLDKAGVLKFEDNTKITPVTATAGVVTPTVPHTWAVNDQIRGVMIYEPA